MDKYNQLVEKSFNNNFSKEDILWILQSEEVELLPLLYASYQVRYKYFQNKVKIHLINNVKSGNCGEDCYYCAQSHAAKNEVVTYPLKNKEEILKEADFAYKNGAYRYCMVFSGSNQKESDIDYICEVVQEIKSKYKMEVCVSAGFLTEEKAKKLKEVGVNRYNHNLNTSSIHYKNICSSHDFKKRLDTLQKANIVGLDICSGVIIGMGETIEDIYIMTKELKEVNAKSVPINFFIPVKGHRVKNYQKLTPLYCLKVLAIFRFALPSCEIRCAGGREYHLRSLQALSLYPANSIFAQGYLTTGGDSFENTIKMIEDAGFILDRVEY